MAEHQRVRRSEKKSAEPGNEKNPANQIRLAMADSRYH